MNQPSPAADIDAPAIKRSGQSAQEPRTLDSDTLFKGERELRIMHGDACYRLTITRLNKLILTK
ncbi:hemin uptake protein HemP [Breoghania sp. JC706]|uniref:hemin uptake protein HemP n=1 Tax=Breoghania sp. JC706 TaxID=3117732 RepID=UPI003008F49B